ncbi:MAG: hypothetical protein HYS05_16905 [Acidobacteria bacterium]|nr:hypothetical protein [Acidobacteriota bacterium]
MPAVDPIVVEVVFETEEDFFRLEIDLGEHFASRTHDGVEREIEPPMRELAG